MKYIDAELLRKEVKRLEKIAHKSTLGCADSETRKFLGGKEFAYQHVGTLIDSLQQKPLIHTELCTLIACDVIQSTAKRAIEKPQDKDKEEDLMIKKMEYLNLLEKSFSPQEQPEVDLEKEIDKEWRKCCPIDEGMGDEKAILINEQFHQIAHHFAELGRKQVLQEIYEGKVKPFDKIAAVWLDDEQNT